MNSLPSRLALCAALALGLGPTAQAQNATTRAGGDHAAAGSTRAQANAAGERSGKLSSRDSDFLERAAQSGLAEVESSKLAVDKATHAQVRSFAQHMIDDHTPANQELASLASSKGVKLPTQPSLGQRAQLKLLQNANGANFDRRYAEQMGVKAHEDTVALFRKAASEARDPEVKAFAAKTLPALEQHLAMARELSGSVDADHHARAAGSRDKQQ